eukprot:6198397-Pleurochrysis_carterae.AAC.2
MKGRGAIDLSGWDGGQARHSFTRRKTACEWKRNFEGPMRWAMKHHLCMNRANSQPAFGRRKRVLRQSRVRREVFTRRVR